MQWDWSILALHVSVIAVVANNPRIRQLYECNAGDINGLTIEFIQRTLFWVRIAERSERSESSGAYMFMF
jgi:hypothetical protein